MAALLIIVIIKIKVMKNNIVGFFSKMIIPLSIIGICSLVFNKELYGVKYIYSLRMIFVILLTLCIVAQIIDLINGLKRKK